MRRVSLLINPAAGRGSAGEIGALAADRLTAAGVEVTTLCGTTPAESLRLARSAVSNGADALVAVGGDGIAHLALQAVAGTPTPLGVVPSGTGNDLACMVGLPATPGPAIEALVTALAAEQVRTIDAARSGGTWWTTVLCAGFDSAVNERANRMRWPRGPRRYDLAILAELARLRPRRFEIILDDERLDLDVTLVAVGNGPQYGGGKLICPGALLDDGLLDVTIVGALSRTEVVRLAPRLRDGSHVDLPQATVRRTRRVELRAEGVTAYADGEPIAALPVVAECVPGAVRVLTTYA